MAVRLRASRFPDMALPVPEHQVLDQPPEETPASVAGRLQLAAVAVAATVAASATS